LKTYLVLILMGMSACQSSRQVPVSSGSSNLQPVLVYKTKADYSQQVPVIMNESKTTIVSYPDPHDLRNADGLLTPIALKEGYWLDRKGINGNVAFLNMTYEAYAALNQAPSLEELEKLLLDRDPLTELCNYGNQVPTQEVVKELNKMIRKGTLHKECKPIKPVSK
jgi:hypothetical protein